MILSFILSIIIFCQHVRKKDQHDKCWEKKKICRDSSEDAENTDGKKTINELFRKKHVQDIPKRTFSCLYYDRFKLLDKKNPSLNSNRPENMAKDTVEDNLLFKLNCYFPILNKT